MTMRDTARRFVIEDEIAERLRLEHERNYHKLHVHRDGTVGWSEYNNESSDTIDDRAEGFAAIPSVAMVGTGSYVCNCDHCNQVFNADDQERAIEDGREYDKDAKYATREEAVVDAVVNSDTAEVEEDMLRAFDAIPTGYFDDEEATR